VSIHWTRSHARQFRTECLPRCESSHTSLCAMWLPRYDSLYIILYEVAPLFRSSGLSHLRISELSNHACVTCSCRVHQATPSVLLFRRDRYCLRARAGLHPGLIWYSPLTSLSDCADHRRSSSDCIAPISWRCFCALTRNPSICLPRCVVSTCADFS